MTNPVLLLTAVLGAALLLLLLVARQRHRRLLATVTVVTLPGVTATRLGNRRNVTVYLPPGYDESERRYPVLYVNDGQEREALRLRQTLAELFRARQIRPLIVVAIPTNDNRLHEYGTAAAPNAQGLGTLAADYAHFVTKELMRLIDAQFRTLAAPQHTAFLGASLGGLSAFDVVWNHPHKAAIVGVMSGSFWWRAGEEETAVVPHRLIAHDMVRRGPYRPHFRAWFQVATLDETSDRDNNGVIDAIQDTVELIDELEALGYERGREIKYVEVRGGRHHYHTWAQALPDFLRWAFPR